MVMLSHFFALVYSPNLIWNVIGKLANFGQTGVTLFFVLSGFVITRILLHTKENVSYFKTFIVRRALRILPLYYFFLILYYYVLPLFTGASIPTFNQTWYYFVYLQNFALTFQWDAVGPLHFWTLSIEEHFYLLWPIAVYLLSSKRLMTSIVWIFITAILVRIVLLHYDRLVYCFTFARFDALAIGGLLAVMENKQMLKRNLRKFLIPVLTSTVVLLALLWFLYTGQQLPWIQTIKFSLLSVLYFSLLALLISSKESISVNRILEKKFFQYSGKISYGLYVYHPVSYLLVMQHFFTSVDSIVIYLVLSVGFTYVLAALSFRFVEQPFLRLKKRWKY